MPLLKSFWATICKTVHPMLSVVSDIAIFVLKGDIKLQPTNLCYQNVVCPISLSVCDVGVLWPNGWMDQDAT